MPKQIKILCDPPIYYLHLEFSSMWATIASSYEEFKRFLLEPQRDASSGLKLGEKIKEIVGLCN